MPYAKYHRKQKWREYSQRPEVKARKKENSKKHYHKCLDCNKLIVPRAKRCNSCAMKERKRRDGFILSKKTREKCSERMKKNNPMRNPKIAKKVRDSNVKNGSYEKVRTRMLKGGGRKAWDSMMKKGRWKEAKKTTILTKKLLLKEYVLNKKSIKTISKELNLHYQTITSRLKKFNIPLNKKERKVFRCANCEKIVQPYSIRCRSCNNKNIKKLSKEKLDKLRKEPQFIFGQFINKINHLEHLRKVGFKKGRKSKNYGIPFKKGHKLNVLEKHPNWQGGLSFEPYTPKFNNIFRELIRQRDNYICMICGVHKEKLYRALDVHHIDYNKKISIPQNCISLCNSCHLKTNWNREHWIKFFQSILAEKYNYKYSETGEIILEECLK